MTTPKYQVLTATVSAVLSSPAMGTPVVDLSTREALEYWIALDTLEKVTKKRKEELRTALLGFADSHGDITDKGHKRLVVDDNAVVKEKRVNKTPDLDKLRDLCDKNSIAKSKLPFDVIETLVVNLSKVESLIELGFLDSKDVEALKAETVALQVEPSKTLKALIENLKNPDTAEILTEIAATQAAG